MKPLRMRRPTIYLLVCFVLLLAFYVHRVAGTERGEYLTQRVVVKINPKSVEAHQFLSEYYLKRRDFKKAAKEIEAVLRLRPNPDVMNVIDTCCELPDPIRSALLTALEASSEKPLEDELQEAF